MAHRQCVLQWSSSSLGCAVCGSNMGASLGWSGGAQADLGASPHMAIAGSGTDTSLKIYKKRKTLLNTKKVKMFNDCGLNFLLH